MRLRQMKGLMFLRMRKYKIFKVREGNIIVAGGKMLLCFFKLIYNVEESVSVSLYNLADLTCAKSKGCFGVGLITAAEGVSSYHNSAGLFVSYKIGRSDRGVINNV